MHVTKLSLFKNIGQRSINVFIGLHNGKKIVFIWFFGVIRRQQQLRRRFFLLGLFDVKTFLNSP
jgi:hypothetical protein